MFFELTCPWDSNIQRSHEYKERKYAPLIADLSRRYKVFNYSVEVSARGQISKDNRTRLKSSGMLALDSGVVITGETSGRDRGSAERADK